MKKIWIFVISVMSLSIIAYSKEKDITELKIANTFISSYDYALFKQGNSNKLEIYLKTPLKKVQFLRENDRFIGELEYIYTVYDENDNSIFSDFIRKTIDKSIFMEQKCTNIHQTITIFMPSGYFKLKVQINDLKSSNSQTIELELTLPQIANQPSISDIEFAEKLSDKKIFDADIKGNYYILPSVNRNYLRNKKYMFFYFELYNIQSKQINISYQIKDKNKKSELSYTKNTIFSDKSQLQGVKFDISKLAMGLHTLEIEVHTGKFLLKTEGTFRVSSEFLPFNISLDLAIRSLKYIISSNQLDSLKNAKNETKQMSMLKKIWKSKDKTPETETNEYMEEYYYRVIKANELFHTYKEGWNTDRGKIYIKYGEPDEIERHPFELSMKPYQIWYYYSLGKTFIFVDYGGFGDYELYEKNFDDY